MQFVCTEQMELLRSWQYRVIKIPNEPTPKNQALAQQDYGKNVGIVALSPSGKAQDFDSCITLVRIQ